MRILGRVQKLLMASLAFPLAAGCAHVSALAAPSARVAAPSAGLPLSRAVAERLPAGVFYLLAGTDPASYNLWQVSNAGTEVQLTHNNPGLGISDFGASPAGIVMADAASGYDELARLTSRGAIFLKNGDGSGPVINSAGEICYEMPTYDKSGNTTGFDLVIKKSFTAPGRVVRHQKDAITGNVWGPDQSVAVLSGSHYPGTAGPIPRVFTMDKSGKITQIHASIQKNLSSLVWNEQGGGIGVGAWNNKGEVIYSGSRRYTLPVGWTPATWNPDGTQLLVWGPGPGRKIGLWSPAKPNSIKVIGLLAKKFAIGDFAWLAKPAKL